jgi:hypothetical protein
VVSIAKQTKKKTTADNKKSMQTNLEIQMQMYKTNNHAKKKD